MEYNLGIIEEKIRVWSDEPSAAEMDHEYKIDISEIKLENVEIEENELTFSPPLYQMEIDNQNKIKTENNLEIIEEKIKIGTNEPSAVEMDQEYKIDISEIKLEKVEVEENELTFSPPLCQIEIDNQNKIKTENNLEIIEEKINFDKYEPSEAKMDQESKINKIKTEEQKHINDSDKKPFGCKECGKSFTRANDVKRHARIHTGEKPYSCEQCGKSFAISSALKEHLLSHTDKKPHNCEQCGKSFKRTSDLRKHKILHTDFKTFDCKQCGKPFHRSYGLKMHQQIHTGEKPYSCKQCGKSFRQSGVLKRHEMTHTGKKPFKCKECGKSFIQSGALKQHQETHR